MNLQVITQGATVRHGPRQRVVLRDNSRSGTAGITLVGLPMHFMYVQQCVFLSQNCLKLLVLVTAPLRAREGLEMCLLQTVTRVYCVL